MDFTKLRELKTDNIILRELSDNDHQFISDMFNEASVLNFYIIPKEAGQDYKNLSKYLLNDIRKGQGFSWIIIQKESSLFSKFKACGFIGFEFRDSLENVRINCAIKSEFRRRCIATKAINTVIETLKSIGITSIEADIDKDNEISEKLIVKLGFTTNKRGALYDPEIRRNGEIRFRHLWRKDLSLKTVNESEIKSGRFGLTASQSELISAINNITALIKTSGQHPKLVAKYFYLLGRIKFNEKNYEEAKEAFGQCNKINMFENLPQNHETFYWFARMRELENKPKDAKMYYGFALEKFSNDPELISRDEIQRAINKLS
jgi:RimJ/RimL family protein N-acetyltransferase